MELSKIHRKMEGHSQNFWNDIADQNVRRNGGKSIKNPLKIFEKSPQIGPKSVLEALLGHPGAIFPPRQLQERKKRPKRPSRTPPRIQVGSQNRCKIDPEASKRNIFLYLFSDRVRTPLGTDFHRIWGPKMDQKSSQNRCPERSCRKCQILKKPYVFIRFLRIRGVGNPIKIVFEPSFEKDAQPHPKMFAKIANLAPKTTQVEGQVGSQIAARGYPRASSKKDRKID